MQTGRHPDERARPAPWAMDFTLRGRALYERLPPVFTFDEFMTAADALRLPSLEAVEHLRILFRESMLHLEGTHFFKTGPEPDGLG